MEEDQDEYQNMTIAEKISYFYLTRLGLPIMYATIIVGLPSLALYCSQCWLIIRHRQFHSTFYMLFVARAIHDILLMLSSYIHFRLPFMVGPQLFAIYEKFPNWLLTAMLVFYYYSMEGGSLATCILLLNRLSAIIFPFNHENFWRKCLPIALVIIFGTPLYFARYFFGMQCYFQINPDGSFVVNENHQNESLAMTTFVASDSFLLFTASLTFLVICSLINIAILVAYKWRRKRALSHGNGNGLAAMEQKTENKLLVYAVGTFASHMLLTFLMIGYYLAQLIPNWLIVGALLEQTPWVFDFGSILMPSWLLLWASVEFRQQWCAHFVPKWMRQNYGRLLCCFAGTSNNTIHAMANNNLSNNQNSAPALLWATQRLA